MELERSIGWVGRWGVS